MGSIGWTRPSGIPVLENDVTLRRFIPLRRFLDLLQNQILHFSSASSFDDQFEGHPTNQDQHIANALLEGQGFDSMGLKIAADARKMIANNNQQTIVVSCWTLSSPNDQLMWERYAGGNDGVVVETSVGRLHAVLNPNFWIVPIQYVTENEIISQNYSPSLFCFKRDSYAWEREVRVMGEMEMGSRIGLPRRIQMEIKTLISKIHLHKDASERHQEQIRLACQEFLPDVPILVGT